MDDSFIKAPLAVPKLSGFDKSHQNLLTSKVGTITPILCDELIPGTKVNLKLALNASLPPLATDTFMRCSIKSEAFFVPMRLLDGGFESFFTDEAKSILSYDEDDHEFITKDLKAYMPIIRDTTAGNDSASWISKLGNGTLADYLGVRTTGGLYFKQNPITALPFLAYHRIWNDWYRNTLIQKECFLPTAASDQSQEVARTASSSPYVLHDSMSYIWNSEDNFRLADGHSLLDLRQRNFGLDYFTTATPSPQQGNAMKVSFDTSGSTGEFSIGYLRSINSMQQFKERNNLLGNIYVDQLYGRYGVRPSDGIAQRSLYLGRGEFEVYSKGVYQTNGVNNNGDNPVSSSDPNPFGSVASRYGSAYASGENFLVNFEAKEPGYLFVMATLVPRVTYSSGVDRMMHHYVGDGSISDMANPILQNVGPQPIYNKELTGFTGPLWNVSDEIFGYTDRYAEFKTKNDTLHGLVRDGQSLQAFALQRSFSAGGNPIHINSAFLQIPTNYMDQVTAVSEWISTYGYWLDTYFDYRVAMPLSKYSLPTLQDPAYEHGRSIVVNKGGSKL